MRVFKDDEAAPYRSTIAAEEQAQILSNLAGVKTVIAFGSARGGVGKSILAVNLAVALASTGRKVALLDADLNSPTVLPMLGIRAARRTPAAEWLEPIAGPLGLRVIGPSLLPDPATPISFLSDDPAATASANDNGADPGYTGYTRSLARLLSDTRFGALDLLIIDLAPGLEAFARLAQLAPKTKLVAVCHPSALSTHATAALLAFAAERHATVVGVVENMAGFICDNCHSVRPLMPQGSVGAAARNAGVPVLERFPFDPRLAETGDRGTVFVREYPDTPLGKQLLALADAVDRTASSVAPEHAATL